jgi:ribosomal protein L40E
MKYLLVLTAALGIFPVAARAAEAAPPTEETAASPVDLSGYRVCPQCNTLNPPQADYCMRCGAELGGRPEETKTPRPAAVKSFAVTPFGFAGNYEAAGGGVRGRFDRSAWSYTPVYAYDARWPGAPYDSHQHHLLANEGRFYFGAAAVRPFLGGALEGDYYYYRHHYYPGYERESHTFIVFAGFGGGLELNYDPRGSFFDVRGFAGPAVTWAGGPDGDSRTLVYFSFDVGNVVYFSSHFGLDVRLAAKAGMGYYSDNRVILEIGPAFAW